MERDLSKAWPDFAKTVQEHLTPLAAMYVDFLGGLALREEGFDDKVCLLADGLVSGLTKYFGQIPGTVTVPAVQQATTRTLARVVHLGFPEWTFWAIPLTVNEFWHAVVNHGSLPSWDGRISVLEESPDTGLSPVPRRELLADIIATLIMGPAYAYAWFMLSQYPHTITTEDSPDSESKSPADGRTDTGQNANSFIDNDRAWTILKTLKRMNSEVRKEGVGIFGAPIATLEKEWQQIVKLDAAGYTPSQAMTRFIEDAYNWVAGNNLLSRSLLQGSDWNEGSGLIQLLTEKCTKLQTKRYPDGTRETLTPEQLDEAGFMAYVRLPPVVLLNHAWQSRVNKPENADCIADVVGQLISIGRRKQPSTGVSLGSDVSPRGPGGTY
jgi:hypothetical protein